MTVRPLGPDLVLVGFEPSRHLEPVAAIVPSRERLVFADVYAAHFDLVWRSLRHLGVPERLLDDAVQDVWLIVHRKLDEFDGRSTASTWLFGICINVARSRRRAREVVQPAEPLSEDVQSREPSPRSPPSIARTRSMSMRMA